jgi:hypothetical protein
MSKFVDIAKSLAINGAKTLATAFGGPLAGNAIGWLGLTGDQIVKLRELDNEYKKHLDDNKIQLQIEEIKADASNRSEVNQTMRAEAASEHWPTYSWRPFIGFEFGILTFGVYFVLPLMNIPVPEVPYEVWMAFGAILGVASWYRGRMQADPSIPTSNKG